MYFSTGRFPFELAQRPSRVALASHIARSSTPFGVTSTTLFGGAGAVTCSQKYQCALSDLQLLWEGHIRVTPLFAIDSLGPKLTVGFPFQCVCVCHVHLVGRPSYVLNHPCAMLRQRGMGTRGVFSTIAVSFRTCRRKLWRCSTKMRTSTARTYSMPDGLSIATSGTQANWMAQAIPISIHIGFPSGIIR